MQGINGKTKSIALLASWLAAQGHKVIYASRENTTLRLVETSSLWPFAKTLRHT